MIGRFWRSSEDIMPFKNVGLGGVGDDVGRGILGDGLVFAG
jgi:hypothetical protein